MRFCSKRSEKIKRIIIILFSIGLVFFLSGNAIGAIWYVDGQLGQNPTDCNGGNTWTTAFKTAEKAYECASAGDEIWVKEGVYDGDDDEWPELWIEKEISIYGSFAGDETHKDERDLSTHRTIITNVYAPLNIYAATTIDGFEITGHSVPIGINGSTLGIPPYSVVISNIITHHGSQGPYISHGGTAFFINCTISDMYHQPYIIYDNSSVTFTNCTIWNNLEAIRVDRADASATFTNCIYWNNSFAFDDGWPVGSKPIATYCNIEGGYPGEGNINADPLFVSSSDLHLKAMSPCIDAGTRQGAPDKDIEGTPRPQGSGYDMGAYEFIFPNVPPVANAGPDLAISKYNQSATVVKGTASDPDGDSMQYRWLEEGVVLQNWQDVGSNGEAYLYLSTLDLFEYGAHVFTLEVSDEEFTHADNMDLTIQTSTEVITEVNNDPLLNELYGVRDELNNALTELNKTPPDIIAATGKIEGAVNKLQDAIKDEILDPVEGKNFMDLLSSAAWQFAADAIDLAISRGGDPVEIGYAQDYLAAGESFIDDAEALFVEGEWQEAIEQSLYKEAVIKFKDALDKAQDA